ncbi:restriction endonuclease subunit S [Stieleria varia]|uniref:EcoKI restriction-modification system protein HsdS n=1 Tax=Stieleria varia TaxID=2528005 RepID=A0A5C6AT85_9BACT|nr:restriction endonuclease subunit S [Stieleria varia]TWU02222.1 EcoKI restriction-modification system protein HsdS [Stieleria varia]
MSHSDWQSMSIGSLGRIVTGKTPTSKKPELFGDDYPFITPSDLDFDRPHVPTERYLSDEGRQSQKNQILPKDSVCFTCIGATIGKLCKTARPSFTNQQINSVIVNAAKYDAWFVYYLLRFHGKKIASIASGAATPIVNKTTFAGFEISIPPLPTQRKIASILSAYDDLIENNTRRIAILEEMAQAIYREWFVNFRFPGHENVKLVDSPLGQIPEGWETGVVNDLLKLLSGFAFKSKTFVDDGGYKVVTIKHVHDGEFQTNSMSLLDSPPDRMPVHCHLETADVLMSLTGNIGRTCLVFGENFLLNQRVAKLHPHRPQDRPLVYWMFRSPDTRQRLEQIANGVAQQNLSPVQTGKMEIPIPPLELRDSYAEVASPMVEAILNLNRKNANLRTSRDLLLPKLISGKLDVEDLDIDSGLTAEALEEATA